MIVSNTDVPDELLILDTARAAAALNRTPQTLRHWACQGTGPIKPLKIGSRLAWRLSDIKKLLAGEVMA